MTAPERFSVALAQLNPSAGDVEGNLVLARAARAQAALAGAALLVFPELFIAGNPSDDLLRMPAFQAACRAAVEELARATADSGPAVLIGAPWVDAGRLYDAMALLDEGRVAALRYKVNLGDHGDCDETACFARGPVAGPLTVRGLRIGVAIGDTSMARSGAYEHEAETLAETGAELLIVPAATPYVRDGADRRLSAQVASVTQSDLPLVCLNRVGAEGERVYDGASFVLNADCSLGAQLPAFVASVTTLDLERTGDGWACHGPVAPLLEGDRADYSACVLGLRDAARKHGYADAVLAISGRLDEALGAAMAVDALGAAHVRGVLLRDRTTAQAALDDAAALATALGIRLDVVPIDDALAGHEATLSAAGLPRGAPDPARIRATLLAAIAEGAGALMLTCGTTPGDGFDPLGDLDAAEVLRLGLLRNGWMPADGRGPAGAVISAGMLARPPARNDGRLPPRSVRLRR